MRIPKMPDGPSGLSSTNAPKGVDDRRKGAIASRIIAIGGGKGGVGKSVLSANLGVAFAQRGFRVVVVDCDLGAANLHTLLDVTHPNRSLTDLIARRVSHLNEVVEPTRIPGLSIVAGAGAVPGAANINHGQKLKLIRHLYALDADVVLLDVGAGSSFNTVDVFTAADLRIVVTTPQLTSIQNAYGFVKAAVYRVIRQAAISQEERIIVDEESRMEEKETVANLLARIEKRSAILAARASRRLKRFGGRLVGNQLHGAGESNTLYAVQRMIRDYLGVDLPVVATLPQSPEVHRSVNRRQPLVLQDPFAGPSRQVRLLVDQLLREDVGDLREDRGLTMRSEELDDQPRSVPDVAAYTRREARLESSMKALVVTADDAVEARTFDLSCHGACLKGLSAPLAVGDEVRLMFEPEMEIEHVAVVRWQTNGRAGLEITSRGLDAAVVAAWADAYPPSPNPRQGGAQNSASAA